MRAFALLAAALVAAFCSGANAFAQSPFYLTFERSYSAREEVKLRIDYTNPEEPIHVRVLRPKDITRFLDGQTTISRSYEEPRAALNPGHYLANGINSMRSPVPSFQRLLSPEFRRSWGQSLSPAVKTGGSKKLVTAPKLITHEPPPGFDVVSDLFIDLRRGGSAPQDQWWWFFDQAAEAGSWYSVRTVSLGRLPAGLLLVQAVQEGNEAQALLQVSELSVQVKQSSNDLLVRCVDRDGKPVAGVSVSVRNGRGVWQEIAERTDQSGTLLFRNTGELDSKLVVKAVSASGEAAFSDTDFLPIRATSSNMLILTDRPIFKPGEEVKFKGILRTSTAGELSTAKVPVSKATLLRQDGTEASKATALESTEFGSVSGSFSVSPYDSPGLYSVVAESQGEPYAGELRVRDYVKPSFYLELASHSGQLRPGEKFSYKVRARRYAGGAPQGAKFEVYVYRKKFDVPQFVEDSGGGLQTGSDYFGNTNSTAAISNPQRVYSSLDARISAEERSFTTESWATAAAFDMNGEAQGEITLPPLKGGAPADEWTYSIVFRAMDREGSFAVVSENFHQTLSEGVVSARFSKVVAKPGESGIRFTARVTTPEGVPISGAQGAVEFIERSAAGAESKYSKSFVTNESGYGVIGDVLLGKIGVVEANAVATGTTAKTWAHPARAAKQELLVLGTGGEPIRSSKNVVLFADTTVVSPGEKVAMYALLPDGWGSGNSGPVWRTVASDKVHSVEALQGRGQSLLYESEAKPQYGTGYFETLTVPVSGGGFQEATIGLRIVPWKKRLKIVVSPEKEIGEPMKPFALRAVVTDADGKPASNVELSLAVVDRAVYAVQPEFRPSIFDFFFPMPRLNLMTFYSDELQGYGYAAEVKKPNFSLTAIKSQTKLSKRSMRDTAGWFPHLLTNAAGEVSVTLDMPGNLTEWLVTATAIDKQGRVGEGNGRFRTAVDVEAEPRAPQFLRGGDSVAIPISVRNQAGRPVEVRIAGEARQGMDNAGQLAPTTVELSPAGEEVRTMNVSASTASDEVLLSLEASTDEALKLGGTREFEVPVKRAALETTLSAASSGNAPLSFALPQGATPLKLSVTTTSGLLGVILTRAKELATYPYGCAEQLAHTITPNLALLELVKAIPDLAKEGGEFEPLIRKARAHAEAGFRKLSSYQKANGGFSLWPNDPEPSPLVTLLVTAVMQKGDMLQIEGVSRRFWNASGWLEKASRETWAPYELFLIADRNLAWGRPDTVTSMVALVREVLDKADVSFAKLVYAAGIATHFEAMPWHNFSTQLKEPQASKKLLDKLALFIDKGEPSVVSYDRQGFSGEEIGFSPSTAALVADALGILAKSKRGKSAAAIKLKRWLVAALNSGDVSSPLDVAYVIDGVMPIVLEEIAQNKAAAPSVALIGNDKKPIGMLRKIRGGYSGEIDVRGTPLSNLSNLTVAGATAESFSFSGLSVDVPFNGLEARSTGVTVKRSLFKIVGKGAQPLADRLEVGVGDVIISKVEVVRAEDPKVFDVRSSEWLVVRDSIPSIAEPIDDDKTYLADAGMVSQDGSYWSSVRETLRYPDRVDRVVRLAPGASFVSYAVWRVGFVGTAVVGPAHAFDMYSRKNEGFSGTLTLSSKRP